MTQAVRERALQGQRVAITGRLASMKRDEAVSLLEASGGEYARTPDRETAYLVVGEAGWPLREDGRLTHSLEVARSLRQAGAALEIVTETAFLILLGLHELRPLYTAQQLSRILKVPSREIVSWIRRGLIEPVKVVNRLYYFDFAQVASAKTLGELIRDGVSPARLRTSLSALESWFPGAKQSLAQLRILERSGELLVRLHDGSLADARGQLQIDFEEHASEPAGTASTTASLADVPEIPTPEPAKKASAAKKPTIDRVEPSRKIGDLIPLAIPRSGDTWFTSALHLEEEGRLAEAAEAYQKSLFVEGPRADVCFNLGNVLYRLGRREEAVQRFMQSVEIDPSYIECWNNLANALADIGRPEEAVRALRKALAVDPHYADAHYNLAELFHQLGRTDQARAHWKSYLVEDSKSDWADHVRERLRVTQSTDGSSAP